MTVFYTCSYYGKKKYQAWYDLVHAAIKRFTSDLISPEEGNYLDVLDEGTRKRLSASPELLHYEAIRQGIHLADAVIIEVSHQDIQLGHEISLALMEKKPVLVLSIYEDMSRKIHHDYLFGARYTKVTLEPTIQDFLAHVREMRLAKRFNMFLYPSQVEYLEKAAKQYGMNMSEYVRRLINLDRRNVTKQS
jgi:hypothetical protein